MTRALDILLIVVVVVFAGFFILVGVRSCEYVKENNLDGEVLESSVRMGEDDPAAIDEQVEEWDHLVDEEKSRDAEGIDPDEVTPENASVLAVEEDQKNKKKEEEELEEEVANDPETIVDDAKEKESHEEEVKINKAPVKTSKDGDFRDYLVIAGSFKSEENANVEYKRITNLGYTPEILKFDHSSLFSLCVRRCATRSDALSLVAELKQKHKVSAYMHKKRIPKEK